MSRWVTIADRLSQFGVWCCEVCFGEAGVVTSVVSWTGMLRQAGRGRASCGGVGRGRRGKFERGMVGLVAAGGVRRCQARSVIGMLRLERRTYV